MKKLFLILFLAGLILTLLLNSPLKKDFNFNGTAYSHIKKMSGGEITNHFYTPNGEALNSSQEFIQILEISDKIQKNDWPNKFKPLFNQYKLIPVQGEEFNLAGKSQKAGIFFNSYATIVSVNGEEHMAFYVRTTDTEQNEESDPQKMEIIYELQNIKFN